jgi:hypothetical protein
VPIFTRGEDLSELDRYYETSDVVSIGGLVGTNDPQGFVNGVMKVIGNRRVHFLGFTRSSYLKHYRPYMCDSSSYVEVQLFNHLRVYCGGGQWLSTLHKQDFKTRPSDEIITAIRGLGCDPYELRKEAAWHGYGHAQFVAYRGWNRWQRDLFSELNVRLFFACSGKQSMLTNIEANRYWGERNET